MPEIKVGIRVPDVEAASNFYQGLGFVPAGLVRNPSGDPVLAILMFGPLTLLVDALVGLPFAPTVREDMIQAGPRGLGVVLGLEVPDLDQAFEYCESEGCAILAEIQDTPWGERVFTCLDPFGFEWKFGVRIPGSGGTDAAATAWFGDSGSDSGPGQSE